MSGMIDCRYLNRMYSPLPENRTVRSTAARTSSFLDMAAKASRDTADVLEVSGKPEVSETDETSNVDAYLEHLKKKYGRVTIESIGKDQASLEKAGKRMSGSDVVIAPNILEQMVNDPKKAAYYEEKIQQYYASLPRCQAQLSLMGHEIHSSGIVIHPDGTVTHYVSGDLKPEVRARIEAQMRAEAEAKAERKRYAEKAVPVQF